MNMSSRRKSVFSPAGVGCDAGWRLKTTCRHAAAAVAICLVASGGCARHRIATTFTELETGVKPGRTVYVTNTTGQIQKGTLERFTPASADVNVSRATVHVLERDTVRITVREPLWQGLVIGAGAGAFLGGLAQAYGEAYGCALDEGFGSVLGSAPSSDCDSQPVTGMLIGAGLGAAIGAGLDALMWKRTTVFASPKAGKTARVTLAPIAGRRGVGIRVTTRF